MLRGTEACDDQNLSDGDGCTTTGLVEDFWFCEEGEPSICDGIRGDGKRFGTEQCDDQNLINDDGCRSDGLIQFGYDCQGEPSQCTLRFGFRCEGAPSVCSAIRGDGFILGTEECDDGDTISGDGCNSSGSIEFGFYCESEPSLCASECGDGLAASDEECDDANQSNGDTCTTDCLSLEPLSCAFSCNFDGTERTDGFAVQSKHLAPPSDRRSFFGSSVAVLGPSALVGAQSAREAYFRASR